MLSRFDVTPLLRGHVKGLSRADRASYTPDWGARATLVVPSVALFVCALVFGWTLQAPAAVLTAAALLAGGALTSFTHLSTLRYRWTEQMDDESLDRRRDAVDEAVAHLLLAALLCIALAVLLIIGMNVPVPASAGSLSGAVPTGLTAPIVAVGSYIVGLFVVAVPRLYEAYVESNRVKLYLSGFHRGTGSEPRFETPSSPSADAHH